MGIGGVGHPEKTTDGVTTGGEVSLVERFYSHDSYVFKDTSSVAGSVLAYDHPHGYGRDAPPLPISQTQCLFVISNARIKRGPSGWVTF